MFLVAETRALGAGGRLFRLETPRLVLRDFVPGDATALASYQSDPRYLEHYDGVPDAEMIVRAAIEWSIRIPRTHFQLVIVTKSEGRTIGTVGLRGESVPGRAELGVEIAPDFWSQGYAQEAARALVQFAAHAPTIETIVAKTSPRNVRARATLRNLGFLPTSVTGSVAEFSLSLPKPGAGRDPTG